VHGSTDQPKGRRLKESTVRAHETHTNGPDTDRFARLDALYAQYCQAGAFAEDDNIDEAREVIEVPCELAPGVRRRFAKPATH
jgi:hypothetical protein